MDHHFLDTLSRNNVTTFLDTMDRIKGEESLKACVADSIAAQYVNRDGCFDFAKSEEKAHRFQEDCRVIVSEKRTIEAASAWSGRVCVLNFANARHPGGGVKSGASAQEESLCRITTLYANLTDPGMMLAFYRHHEEIYLDYFGNDDCIFSPNVCVLRTDTQTPELLPEKDRFFVDVITCAAPDMRGVNQRPLKGRLPAIYEKRIRAILETAKKENEDKLILGAFGCGAFQNDPQLVATAFKAVLPDYRRDFSVIEFAVYTGGKPSPNYDAFAQALGE